MAPPIQPLTKRFWSKVEIGDGCWLWLAGRDKDGYGRFWLDGANHPAHHIAYELIIGFIPHGMFVLHHCDNPPCIRPSHLFLGTCADNHADRNRKFRQARGERHGRAKLTLDQVTIIRNSNDKVSELANEFGVSTGAIYFIKSGTNWATKIESK